MASPSRVFATLKPSAGRDLVFNEINHHQQQQQQHHHPHSSARELQVTGVAEGSCQADRATLRIGLSNCKDSVNDVTGSISRRLEYIIQTLRQHGVQDEDISMRKCLRREDFLYQMDAEATVGFSNFEKMEMVCCILLEKMDKSVCVGMPQFHHSAECLSQLRRRTYASAVANAQQKAYEGSGLLGQILGPPLLIREEETREWRNEDTEECHGGAAHSKPFRRPTVNAASRVFVSFTLLDGTR
ncbi:interleukin-1 receptor-associated kinase 1-binding protein 1 homolog [Lampris incognitus]|uniref:interleukin-1 receptor-associated kinase 1-binding protein 1 homolog n=1 Tax=Lampris incognitus TaxID=2546036 RepID=UPI0024B5F2C0|nr:interleukin-1 receptor-associated kinase 1-binding protein 1 homolog [Lampris incognitus]